MYLAIQLNMKIRKARKFSINDCFLNKIGLNNAVHIDLYMLSFLFLSFLEIKVKICKIGTVFTTTLLKNITI